MRYLITTLLLLSAILLGVQGCSTNDKEVEQLVDPNDMSSAPLVVRIFPDFVMEEHGYTEEAGVYICWADGLGEVTIEDFLVDGQSVNLSSEYTAPFLEGRYPFQPNQVYNIKIISSLGTYSAKLTAIGKIDITFPTYINPETDITIDWSVNRAVKAQLLTFNQGWADQDHNTYRDEFTCLVSPSQRHFTLPANTIERIPSDAYLGSYSIIIDVASFVNINNQCLMQSYRFTRADYTKDGTLAHIRSK